MRILTISQSPYLLTKHSKINRELIEFLTQKGHQVESIVWHHDVQEFLPNETGKHLYKGTTIYPFLGQKGQLAPFAFEVMKVAQPKVVITVGDYWDTEFVWSIKSLYPHLFKWIAIIPTSTECVNEKYRLALSYADKIVVTSQKALESFKTVKTTSHCINYGPDHSVFYDLKQPKPKELHALSMGKKSQMSNVPAFLQAIAKSKIQGTVHTNLDDEGDYDLLTLVKRYDIQEKIKFPKKYMSVREGLKDSEMNQLYNDHHIIIDCSLQSSTALTILEAMSTGCLPIGMNFGRVGEVLQLLPKEFQFIVPHEIIVGAKEEEFSVISVKELITMIKNIEDSRVDPEWEKESKRVVIATSEIFSKEKFVTGINELIEVVVASSNFIAVDSF